MTSTAAFFLTVSASCLGVIAVCFGAAFYEARRRAHAEPKPPLPRVTSWPNPYRPMHCSRCHEAELIDLPRVALPCAEVMPDCERAVIETAAQICTACGKVEWFIASPSGLSRSTQDD